MLDNSMDNIIDIQEEQISDMEAARIRKLIVKKVGQKQRSKTRRLAAALAACCLMLTGVTAFALTELNIADMFRAVFGEKASYLDNIFPIEKGVSEAGLSAAVPGVSGYDRNVFIMMEIARDDGMPFIGDNVELMGCSLRVDGVSDLSVSTSNASVVDGKAIVTFNAGSTDGLKGKRASAEFNGLVYRELKLDRASLEISDILDSCQTDDVNLIENTAEIARYLRRYEPRSIRRPFFTEYVRNRTMIPAKFAASQNLNLQLLENKQGLLLDTASFIDGKLHVRVLNTIKDDEEILLYMMDPQTSEIAPMMFWSDPTGNEDAVYYVYDIPDAAQLEQYELMVEYYGDYVTYTGNWNVEFDLDYETKDIDFRPVVDMQGFDDSFVLDEIYVAPTAAYIKFLPGDGNKVRTGFFLAADIRMKDGSYVFYNSCDVTSLNQDYLEYNCFYDPIDINEVDSIIIKSWDQQGSDQYDIWFNNTIKYID
jgi:hypothetical protein